MVTRPSKDYNGSVTSGCRRASMYRFETQSTGAMEVIEIKWRKAVTSRLNNIGQE